LIFELIKSEIGHFKPDHKILIDKPHKITLEWLSV